MDPSFQPPVETLCLCCTTGANLLLYYTTIAYFLFSIYTGGFPCSCHASTKLVLFLCSALCSCWYWLESCHHGCFKFADFCCRCYCRSSCFSGCYCSTLQYPSSYFSKTYKTQITCISEYRWSHISLDKVFSNLLMALSRVPLLMWLLMMVFLFRLINFFFVGNSRTNLL